MMKSRLDRSTAYDAVRVLSYREYADLLGISVEQLRRLRQAKKVPEPFLLGKRKLVIQAGIVLDFIAQRSSQQGA